MGIKEKQLVLKRPFKNSSPLFYSLIDYNPQQQPWAIEIKLGLAQSVTPLALLMQPSCCTATLRKKGLHSTTLKEITLALCGRSEAGRWLKILLVAPFTQIFQLVTALQCTYFQFKLCFTAKGCQHCV